jgi:hypothetical protein
MEVTMAALNSPASATETTATSPGSSGAPRARLLRRSPCAWPRAARAQIRRSRLAVDGRRLLQPLEAGGQPLLQSLEGRAPLRPLEGRPYTRRGAIRLRAWGATPGLARHGAAPPTHVGAEVVHLRRSPPAAARRVPAQVVLEMRMIER